MRMCGAIAAACSMMAPLASLGAEHEGFDGGVFTNPLFGHELEYQNCCWSITDELEPGNFALHLDPNTDLVTFVLDGRQEVIEFRVRLFDTEGGFAGSPTSAVVALGESGDFVVRNASALEKWEEVAIAATDLGQGTGEAIGPIVSVSFQASNEIDGAFFDDLWIELSGICTADFDGDGSIDLFDFLAYANAFNAGEKRADLTGDGVLDLFDFLAFVNLFNAGC